MTKKKYYLRLSILAVVCSVAFTFAFSWLWFEAAWASGIIANRAWPEGTTPDELKKMLYFSQFGQVFGGIGLFLSFILLVFGLIGVSYQLVERAPKE